MLQASSRAPTRLRRDGTAGRVGQSSLSSWRGRLPSRWMIGVSPYTAGEYQVLKVETHLHTLHSDGQDSIEAMFSACLSAGYDAVALTDHNTLSGLDVAMNVADGLGLILIPGVEVTTFRGHAIALGVSRVPEW